MFNFFQAILQWSGLGATLAASLLVAGAASAHSRLTPTSEFYFTDEARTTRTVSPGVMPLPYARFRCCTLQADMQHALQSPEKR